MALQRELAPRDDAAIDFDVRETLRWDMRIDDSNVDVGVSDGVVRLLGRVISFAERLAAAEDAARIKGVRAVQNELIVEPQVLRRDEDIARDVTAALHRDRRIDARRLGVQVSNGIVRLSGPVATVAQRRAAMEDVWYTAGVVDLVDDLTVQPAVPRSDAQIAADVRTALALSGRILDPTRIAVDAQGGTVYLQGGVEDEMERHAAEEAARLVAGVVDVVDELAIAPVA